MLNSVDDRRKHKALALLAEFGSIVCFQHGFGRRPVSGVASTDQRETREETLPPTGRHRRRKARERFPISEVRRLQLPSRDQLLDQSAAVPYAREQHEGNDRRHGGFSVRAFDRRSDGNGSIQTAPSTCLLKFSHHRAVAGDSLPDASSELWLWQDLPDMEAGTWWEQIKKVLSAKTTEHMVLLVSSDALTSTVVRDEWRFARREGVQVWPGSNRQMRCHDTQPLR
jgi:hypothetical protein